MEVDSLVLALDSTITVMLALDSYSAVGSVNGMSHILSVGESEAAWLVIIKDSHSAFSITSNKLVSTDRVVKLYVEVFIRLPAFVINNLDLNDFRLLTRSEGNLPIKSLVIFRSSRSIVASTYSNLGGNPVFV